MVKSAIIMEHIDNNYEVARVISEERSFMPLRSQ
jgi:hypothetical protein